MVNPCLRPSGQAEEYDEVGLALAVLRHSCHSSTTGCPAFADSLAKSKVFRLFIGFERTSGAAWEFLVKRPEAAGWRSCFWVSALSCRAAWSRRPSSPRPTPT